MTRLLAVDYGAAKAMLEVNNAYVTVDINGSDVLDVTDSSNALTAGAWMKVAADFEYPDVWRELAEASVSKLDINEHVEPERERKFRVPDAVRTEAAQGLSWSKAFERGRSVVGEKLAALLAESTYVTTKDIVRMQRYFTRVSGRTNELTGWTAGTEGFPTDERIRFAMRGGDAGRTWVRKIATKHSLTAAATKEVDGDVPHKYVDDPDNPGQCEVCGREPDAPVHSVTASAFEYDDSCEYFGVGVDTDSTVVTALLKHDADGSWFVREADQWVPTDEPAETDIVILLDEDSAYKLASIIDDELPHNPDALPYELTLLNPHEAALFYAAEPELDYTLVDRVFDIYDSTERSINAKKQVRSAGGRFGDEPDDPSSEKSAPVQTKARLPQPLPLVPDVAALIQQYLAENSGETPEPATDETPEEPVQAAAVLDADYVNALVDLYTDSPIDDFNWVEDAGGLPRYIKRISKHLRAKGMTEGHAIATAVNAAKKMCTTGDINYPGVQEVNAKSRAEACKAVAEWEAKKAKAKADNSITDFADAAPAAQMQAGPRPLYLAIVDKTDTEAVLDVVSLMPGQPPVLWKRDKGQWVQAPEILAALQGTTPPPVVELTDDAIVKNVLEQVDKATNENPVEEEEPTGASPQNPDGSPAAPKPDANPDQHPVAASGSAHPCQCKGCDEFDCGLDGCACCWVYNDDGELVRDDNPRAFNTRKLVPPSMTEFKEFEKKKRDKLAKKGHALPDGSFPIESVQDLKNAISAYGRAKNKSAAKSHIKKRAKALGRTDLIPKDWRSENSVEEFTMWGPHGELMKLSDFAEGGLDKNRGNAEKLRRYWVRGEGALKIRWGQPGDWYRCVEHLSKYLGIRAKGYCTLRHHDALGVWPGQEDGKH